MKNLKITKGKNPVINKEYWYFKGSPKCKIGPYKKDWVRYPYFSSLEIIEDFKNSILENEAEQYLCGLLTKINDEQILTKEINLSIVDKISMYIEKINK